MCNGWHKWACTRRAAGGDALLAVLTAVLVVIAFAFVYPQMEGGPFLRAFVIVLAALAIVGDLVTAPADAVVRAAGCDELRRVPVQMAAGQPAVGVDPVFVLWANVHGGYALGLMLIGVASSQAKRSTDSRVDAGWPEVLTWREIGLLDGRG